MLEDDDGEKHIIIRGRREPFYIEVDRFLGRADPEAVAGLQVASGQNQRSRTPSSWGPGWDENEMAALLGRISNPSLAAEVGRMHLAIDGQKRCDRHR